MQDNIVLILEAFNNRKYYKIYCIINDLVNKYKDNTTGKLYYDIMYEITDTIYEHKILINEDIRIKLVDIFVIMINIIHDKVKYDDNLAENDLDMLYLLRLNEVNKLSSSINNSHVEDDEDVKVIIEDNESYSINNDIEQKPLIKGNRYISNDNVYNDKYYCCGLFRW